MSTTEQATPGSAGQGGIGGSAAISKRTSSCKGIHMLEHYHTSYTFAGGAVAIVITHWRKDRRS